MYIRSALLLLSLLAPGLAAQTFVDTTVAAGLSMPTEAYPAGGFARGVATADFDSDGDLDLVIPGYGTTPIQLYLNDGTGVFTLANSNLPASADTTALSAGDIDNDGDPDLYIGRITSDSLYENVGNGTFVDRTGWIAGGAQGSTFGAAFGDYDLDGWTDIAVCVWSTTPNKLFRNGGGNGFIDVTATSGVGQISASFANVWMDYNDDGLPDLYVANDRGMQLHPNSMYENQGDGTFVDVAPTIGADAAIFSMGCDFADAFNDGGQDIYVTDIGPDHLFLVQDPTTGNYAEMQTTYGVDGGVNHYGWGCQYLDYDNDGWLDIYLADHAQPNPLYRNPGAAAGTLTPWTNESATAGLDATRDQSVMLVADWNNDGRLDVLQVYRDGPSLQPGLELRMNQMANSGNWIKFRAVGTHSNRDGWGTKIELHAGGNVQRQTVRSAVGLAGSPDPRVHFGLGSSTLVDRVEVTWPSGHRQVLDNLTANQIVELREPSLEFLGTPVIGATCTFRIDSRFDGGRTYALPLSTTPGQFVLPGGQVVPFAFDGVTDASLNSNPVTPNGVGILPATGIIDVALLVPNDPTLSGFTMFGTALTLDINEPGLVRCTFPTYTVVVP